ncbi:unnamed protein product [Effrenium voratum]|nr:unnamed protein product [Effrenium voratum]
MVEVAGCSTSMVAPSKHRIRAGAGRMTHCPSDLEGVALKLGEDSRSVSRRGLCNQVMATSHCNLLCASQLFNRAPKAEHLHKTCLLPSLAKQHRCSPQACAAQEEMRFCLLFWLACLGDAADSGIPTVDLVHTPWWILAGVTPQGPSIDMGSYNLTSFSKTQQEQFGVNQHGQIVKWSRFTTATAALAPCAEPVTVQHGLNEAQMMRLLGHALDVAWRRAQLEDPQLRMWMEKRSSCQRGCMVKVIGVSLKTLWAVGELLTSAGRGAFAKALESAMRACYPGFRTLNVDSVIEKVATYVGLELRRTHPDMASKSGFAPSRSLQSDIEPCLTHADESRQSFVERMESSVQSALEEARRSKAARSRCCAKQCTRFGTLVSSPWGTPMPWR